jgi:hypothetical protein
MSDTSFLKMRPLSETILELSDEEIIDSLSWISAKPKWEKTGATTELENTLKQEWSKRRKTNPPRVISDIEMVFEEKESISNMNLVSLLRASK